MGALTFDALLQSLKQRAPDPVYYLHGEEDVLKDEAVRALLERSEEHTSELQSQSHLVCRLLLEKKITHVDEAPKVKCSLLIRSLRQAGLSVPAIRASSLWPFSIWSIPSVAPIFWSMPSDTLHAN